MDRYYLDSSALVKYYVQEPGSPAVEQLFLGTSSDAIYTAVLSGAEVVSALRRKERSRALDPPEVDAAIQRFTLFWRTECMVLQVDDLIVESAMELANRHGLRGYDAVQLACAIDLARTAREVGDTLTLWSSDVELLLAAQAESLQTFNPQTAS